MTPDRLFPEHVAPGADLRLRLVLLSIDMT
jgi:hypothetical protein